jgi:D-alanyl-lipoteichoic acid acyltransferase DltB (MBOAT superfamily)
MLFNSLEYILFFLPAVLCLYYICKKFSNNFFAILWIVCSSLFFYSYWNHDYLILIAFSIVFNYLLGFKVLAKMCKNKSILFKKLTLCSGLIVNIAILSYYKYAEFILDNIRFFYNNNYELVDIVLPLAISFFTFQQISFLVDCFQGKTKECSFLNYCFFITFFPQLIAGPIVHHSDIIPQLSVLKREINYDLLIKGLFLFFLGLVKKVYVADTFVSWAEEVPNTGGLYDAWVVSLYYTFQIYYDFSAYSDMAIGSALLFGIRLPENFNSPYQSRSIREFWVRWHMTLSRWLRDYLYIPLGGSKKTQMNTMTAILATFLIGGLWHGPSWNFVIWGALNGMAVIICHYFQRFKFQLNQYVAWIVTFFFINFSWVFFKVGTFSEAEKIISSMFGLNGIGVLSPTSFQLFYLFVVAIVTFIMPNALKIISYTRQYSGGLSFSLNNKWVLITSILMFFGLISFLGDSAPAEFLYFQF